jgi:putative oxidoreductase
MNQTEQSELAAFILRVTLGVMYLAHSVVLKMMTFTLAGTAAFFVSVGLPGWLAYVTFAAEALLPALFGAIMWVHGANGWVFTATNGGWEYPAFLIAASVVQILLGDGAYALSRSGPLLRLSPVSA